MNFFKFLFGTIWTILLFILIFCMLRIMTSASKNDFNGNGTLIYTWAAIIYIVITCGLGFFLSKKWFFFVLAFIILTILAPFVAIFMLNHFDLK
ncbi:hypothetical protein [Enterococcus sp. DIV0086]|uniref:hypothetical protein n=1 Tax=Enterococcus sp. DIV0086 TaxID=2774655 RepID=UPI003D2A86E2